MEGYHERELKELFQNASKFMTTIAGEISSDQLLYFYARYKQVKYCVFCLFAEVLK